VERRQSTTARRIIVAALTWLVALLIVEAGVRAIHPEAGRPIYPGYPAGLVVPDATLGHAFAPNFAGSFPAANLRDIPITTNALGYRDVEWAAPDPARPRVMVLGDSVAFGSAVRREDRFSERAADVLGHQLRPAEFCNCGVNDYNIEQYATVLRQRGPALQPRVVLVALVLNDAESMDPDDARYIALARAGRGGGAARLRWWAYEYRFDAGQSYLFNFARRAIKTRLWQSTNYGARLTRRYNDETWANLARLYADGRGLARLRENLTAMNTFARDQLRARLAVVVFAYHRQLTANDPALSRKIDALLQVLNIPTVDLFDVFLSKGPAADLYVPGDDVHPNIAGHQLAGEAVAELITPLLQ
jgi:lysophospholipase L1-like esterase